MKGTDGACDSGRQELAHSHAVPLLMLIPTIISQSGTEATRSTPSKTEQQFRRRVVEDAPLSMLLLAWQGLAWVNNKDGLLTPYCSCLSSRAEQWPGLSSASIAVHLKPTTTANISFWLPAQARLGLLLPPGAANKSASISLSDAQDGPIESCRARPKLCCPAFDAVSPSEISPWQLQTATRQARDPKRRPSRVLFLRVFEFVTNLFPRSASTKMDKMDAITALIKYKYCLNTEFILVRAHQLHQTSNE
ncbi:uncharacterized protein TRIVIDRAFT_199497 [Trichoderma virens Gv29-8]|uniref:Uncharacterized protein n=1 Tax=Hypocrea virens (strain Gv29-8 / FGSC 10586) TaxID=413071 RepID=G9ML39_HYPVG|nr:uncharacterized protein TRIVIDRAFT_199497 [Trichoderma virens Gv29-8]EHK24933.1 hypothetical protein TRIVIDRAFT_199497 [Trichoderma virens Gv29-8]